jgi:polysaccharide biosynthesis/export protein
MQLGRFYFVRAGSLFALALISICSFDFSLLAQNAASPGSAAGQALPAVQPISQAAQSVARANSDARQSDAKQDEKESQDSIAAKDASLSVVRLGPGDLIEVSVYNVPELSTKARVGNSGDVYLPLIDYVHIGGLTIDEAQTAIQSRLEGGGFVHTAHVTIFIDESASEGVTIIGEVAKPGIYPALADRKLYSFISAAGGFSAAAGRKVSIIRQNGQSAPITVNLPRNLADSPEDNIDIFPGDTITVPRAPVIYVVGDVGHPTGLLVDNGSLTVLQAIALAGGTNRTAKMGSVRVIRKGPTGMTETKIPLRKMLEAKVPDVNLQADDILFVPLSAARYAAGQSIQAAVSAATGIAVIAAHP